MAPIERAVLEPQRDLDDERADGDAGRQRELLGDGNDRGRPAHQRRLDLGIRDGVDGGELQRAEEAAGEQDGNHHGKRHAGEEARAGGEKSGADETIVDQHRTIADAFEYAWRRRPS